MPIFSPSCKGERGFREVKKLCRGHTADGSGRWDFNPGLWQAGPWSRGPPTRVGREPLRGSIDSETKPGLTGEYVCGQGTPETSSSFCVRKSTLNHQTAQGSPTPTREENLLPEVSGRVLSYFFPSTLGRGDSPVAKTEPTGEETYPKTHFLD